MQKKWFTELTYRLRQFDPGLLHSRQAGRTVLSVIITALILANAPFVMKFMACMVSGTVQQGLVGYRRSDIQISMLISSLAILLYFFITVSLLQPTWLNDLNLIIGAFLVFYVRRFGPRYNLFPVFVWLTGFSTSVFIKNPSGAEIIGTSTTILIGLFVAIIIRFWLIPDIRAQQFSYNLHAFFYELRHALKNIGRHLSQDNASQVLDIYLSELKIRLRQTFIQNETILTLSYGRNNICDQKLFYYLHCQYNAGKSLIMLIESLIHLKKIYQQQAGSLDTYFKELICMSETRLNNLSRNLYPVIQYKKNFLVKLVIKTSVNPIEEIDRQASHNQLLLNETMLAMFQYHYNLQHLVDNLADFGKA